MKEHYVSYSQAKRLKSLGFDWEVNHVYKNPKPNPTFFRCLESAYINGNEHKGNLVVSAPTLSIAQKWLREVKGWHIQVRINGVRSAYWYEIWSTTPNGPVYGTPDDDKFHRGQYETYEEALSEGISACLNLILPPN